MDKLEFKKLDRPVAVDFVSLIVGKKFFTLDGEREVPGRMYSRFVESVGDLTTQEMESLLDSTVRLQGVIMDLKRYMSRLNI
jgi:hypothetical protein